MISRTDLEDGLTPFQIDRVWKVIETAKECLNQLTMESESLYGDWCDSADFCKEHLEEAFAYLNEEEDEY